jgi:glycosyltransferase involved in cell wall biosynthesis
MKGLSRVKPGLSILIPAYSASRTIGATLVSAIIFKPKGSEILVYLDGDGTKSKILDLAERKKLIRVFKGAKRSGPASAMNFLLDKASNSVVSRLDADDIILPFYWARALRVIQKGKSELVFSSAILFGENLRILPILPQLPYSIKPELVGHFLSIANPFVQSTMVALKASLVNVGGYRDGVAEDYELWLRSALSGITISRLGGFGVLYRLHSGQLTSHPNYAAQVELNKNLVYQRSTIRALISRQEAVPNIGLTEHQLLSLLRRSSVGFRLEKLMDNLIRKSGGSHKASRDGRLPH